ncbi:ATP-binding cassette domain-containing protein [Fulvimarina sp. MAC8]|uniref:thiamine ABC transporter ATP-binding protein n=1 Tax=Fulvimarina sp. MAC8 TaxID=3162874 RepID=UPI0032EE706C
MSDPQPALKLDRAVFARDDWSVTLDLALSPGEWLALVGPSGAGKSTLMDMVAGFLPLTSGGLSIAGDDVAGKGPSERPLSIVFQDNNLFPHLTVFQNIALGIAPNRRVTTEEREAIEEGLTAVGLAGKGGRKPHELSGGERQRAALARAFLRRQPLLLLDEPFASLGPALRRDMMKTLRQLRGEFTETPLTILMVTHHPEDARSYANRVAFLDAGHIAHVGPVESMLGDDAPEAVRRYLGSQEHSSRFDTT